MLLLLVKDDEGLVVLPVADEVIIGREAMPFVWFDPVVVVDVQVLEAVHGVEGFVVDGPSPARRARGVGIVRRGKP